MKSLTAIQDTPESPDEQVRVLVVDDQQALLRSLQALLRINGYLVDLATGGEEAIRKIQENSYQLLLLDLQMPGVDGLEVLEFIRQSALDLEIVVISGETSFTAVKEAMRLGANDFIRKPYNPQELLMVVSQGLEHRRARAHLRVEQKGLAESERLHRFIVNHSPDLMYMLDARGRFKYLNNMIEPLLGYQRRELLGRHFSSIIHPHNAEEIHNFFSEQRTGGRAVRSVEVRLLVNRASRPEKSLDNDELIVELNAVGLYQETSVGERTFIGTLGTARDITERKRSERHINYQAYHDLLTRLPNRLLFNDRVNQALVYAQRHGQKFALLFMDLDRFKAINDNLGHIMGDRVLQQVSERILACLRAEDTLCRFGGDEFALLLPNIEDRTSVCAVAEKILREVRKPFRINQHEVCLSLSLGIALYPVAGETGEALLQSADIAMYHVKANNKNGYCFYSDTMGNGSAFLSVERDLKKALDHNQLQVFFQPKVNPRTHALAGLEALLRWQHPQRGLLYPEDFLSAAEESNLMGQIGTLVLRQVCRDILRWQDQGLPGIRVSLNIAPGQLAEDDFAEQFIRTLQEFGLPAELFELELTEQSFLRDVQQTAEKIRILRDYGVAVTIDDFGRGYSSLSYLQNMPISSVKIDRSFVRDIGSKQNGSRVVDGIAMMARGMRLRLVAEGVENLKQLEFLRDIGCDQVQGYLYSKATSSTEILALMQSKPLQGPHFTLPQ